MSLRVRLLAGLAALTVIGLAGFGTVTYLSVSHVLGSNLDGQLKDAARALSQTGLGQAIGYGSMNPSGPSQPNNPFGSFPGQNRPSPEQQKNDELTTRNAAGPQLFVEFIDPTGVAQLSITATAKPAAVEPVITAAELTGMQATGTNRSARAQPVSPASIPVTLLDAQPVGGGPVERVSIAFPPGGGAIVVAGSLASTQHTLQRLLEVEIGVGLAVLLVSLGLGLALARQATRPLEEIAATADAIAAGDLDARVPAEQPRSEAGRVAVALNAMLARIQEAFSRRDATEARLRSFVADASHELSTPLTSIRGYAELFHRGLAERPQDLAKALDRIESEATRMGVLVDDLLMLASFDGGRPLHQGPVDLSRIAADTGSDLRAIEPERPVAVEAPAPVVVVGDESRLRQVAANLVSNVRRHTPPATPVTLRARAEGRMGVIEVADRGPGMTEEQAARVFDRFYRVSKARSRAMGGAGLGLSIVASIAEAHGGQASVVTALGAGTTFSVAIPLAGVERFPPNP